MTSVLVVTSVVVGARAMSSRSGVGRRLTFSRVSVIASRLRFLRVVDVIPIDDVQTCDEIDPYEPPNMEYLVAFERTQAAPHSFCLNDDAVCNM